LAVWLCAGWCCAQSWEVGGAIGYGAYRDVRVNGAGAQATAGIRNRFVAGGVVTEDLYEHLSGEIRYQYQDGDPFLSLNGKTGNMQGQSHSFSYDVLVHVKPREEKLRPFVALGMGARWYRSTGPEPNPQPAPALAALTHDDDWKLLVTVGGGVTYKLPNHLLLRADFRDGITPFPKKIFVPAAGATDRGLFQMFTTTIGVGYWF
jgi:opacity protein-like surface antigen